MTPAAQFRHDALIYDSDQAFERIVGGFVHEGVEQGEGAVVATTAANIELLRSTLGGAAGGVHFIRDADWYRRPGSTIAGLRRWMDRFAGEGRTPARFVGEVRFGDTDASRVRWTRLESALNVALADCPVWVICPYDERRLPGEVIDDAYRTHPATWSGRREPNSRYVEPARLLRDMPEALPDLTGDLVADQDLGDDLRRPRYAIREAASRSGLTSDRTEELILAAGEVMANAVRHGAGRRRLRIWSSPDGVVCDVTDEGPGPVDPLVGYRPPANVGFGGAGLWLAMQCCEELAIASGPQGTTVRVSMGRNMPMDVETI